MNIKNNIAENREGEKFKFLSLSIFIVEFFKFC
jgi:hypothetical protein